MASDGQQGLQQLRTAGYDVVVLDIMLPKLDGLTVLKRMRDEANDTPVLLLTARDSVPDRVQGLRAGADDYLIKPFAFDELLARLHALVRRRSGHSTEILQVADLQLNPFAHTVTRAGVSISMNASEYRLLELLMRNKGHVLSRLEIEECIWDVNYERNTNMVDVYISHLRNKVDKPFGRPLIRTVRGFGYKIEAADAI